MGTHELPSQNYRFYKYVNYRCEKMCQLLRCTSLWRPIRGPVKSWPLALCDNSNLNVDAIEIRAVAYFKDDVQLS